MGGIYIKKILYVLHSGSKGGTFLTNMDLMKNVEKYLKVYLLTAENNKFKLFHYSKNKLSFIKEYCRKNKWSAKNFHDSWLNYIYFNILIEFDIDIVHIRHFINHSFDLPEIASKLNIPVIVSLHDFYLICPYYVLLNENNEFCNGQCNDNSKNCYNSLASLDDIHAKNIIYEWRKEILKMMYFVDVFITTSNFVKDLFLSIYPTMGKFKFEVIEHGRDFPKLKKKCYEIPNVNKPIKILCPANYLNIMKGADFIKNIKKEDVANKLEFHFLGNCRDDVGRVGISHGTFERDEFHKKAHDIMPSFIGIFSIWPETFCHTLTEAWSCEIPVIGSNIGVIKDRILNNGGGWIIDINNPRKAYNKILEISSNKEEYVKIQKNISNISLRTTKEMAECYLNIYNNYIYFI